MYLQGNPTKPKNKYQLSKTTTRYTIFINHVPTFTKNKKQID